MFYFTAQNRVQCHTRYIAYYLATTAMFKPLEVVGLNVAYYAAMPFRNGWLIIYL